MSNRSESNKDVVKRTNYFLPRLLLLISVLSVLSIATFSIYKLIYSSLLKKDSVISLYNNWEKQDNDSFNEVYRIADNILQKDPTHNTARIFKAYSAFILAESTNDLEMTQNLMNEAIFNLRVALVDCKKSIKPQVLYMLGKSYFYKNKISFYNYYSDLAIKYLSQAEDLGYKAEDLALLKGLSYASLGMTEESLYSFTEALVYRETDTLLFDIAKQYFDLKQYSISKQYLHRILDSSENEEIIINTHLLLGRIFLSLNNFSEAEKEFKLVLEKNENSDDSHYHLGVLYEMQGNIAKARDHWRKCLRINYNHSDALKKLSEKK